MVEVGANHHLIAAGLKPEFWKTANAVRRIFKEALERVGLPYFNPVRPQEWFLVPLQVIDQVVARITDGSITDFEYDAQSASLRRVT